MQNQNLSVAKTLNPTFTTLQSPSLAQFFNPLRRTLPSIPSTYRTPKPLYIQAQNRELAISRRNDSHRRDIRSFAGRSKGKSGGTSPGRIEGSGEFRRQAKRNARRKSKKLAESLFYRLKNPHGNYPDNFSEEELQMIGLGYDRMVRFMERDDPNLKHPYDWYKYGQFGPYSWRGVVLGEPIRGRFSDPCVSMIGEVRDQEEWEKIEQHEMAQEFQNRLDAMDKNVGFRYFWVFVRHPKWRISDFPWQQWTLVSEVVVEAGNQRLDKWNLMGRLGNKARSLITQCAAWMRPDIVYVQRPVYQCRFEPQDDFFKALTPLLDPETEQDCLFELEDDNGRVEFCTYFGGLCKIVRVNPKAFVDDVVKAYEKLSDEKKSKCLGFLLDNHPVPLLHPYTKEWKVKLEEMEMGCDAPDDDDYGRNNKGETEIVDWIEDEEYGEDDDDNEDEYDVDLDASGDDDDELGIKEDDDSSQEEDTRFWEDEFKKALGSNEAMEKFAKKYMETSTKFYEKHINAMEDKEQEAKEDGGDELAMRGVRVKISPKEWESHGFGPWRRKLKKGKMPPELFMRAAVRPFTYKNLVKEIVLTRHAILEGEISKKK
ncbi:hypothetical protein KY290_032201 [Solanum tuberosum]|uniref:Uncharacterized protein n=1 Tax=Solanum tuberosum TaxID=4113 RepID=A0ABQ7UBG8_SOLTU|nr:hypothetical protein KY290_032201 [Solanum tuberosum]